MQIHTRLSQGFDAARSFRQQAACQLESECLTMKEQLQVIQSFDPDKVFIVRDIKSLGFSSGELLEAYFGMYGEVDTVFVSHSRTKSSRRNTGQVVAAIRKANNQHQVNDVTITVCDYFPIEPTQSPPPSPRPSTPWMAEQRSSPVSASASASVLAFARPQPANLEQESPTFQAELTDTGQVRAQLPAPVRGINRRGSEQAAPATPADARSTGSSEILLENWGVCTSTPASANHATRHSAHFNSGSRRGLSHGNIQSFSSKESLVSSIVVRSDSMSSNDVSKTSSNNSTNDNEVSKTSSSSNSTTTNNNNKNDSAALHIGLKSSNHSTNHSSWSINNCSVAKRPSCADNSSNRSAKSSTINRTTDHNSFSSSSTYNNYNGTCFNPTSVFTGRQGTGHDFAQLPYPELMVLFRSVDQSALDALLPEYYED